MLSSCPQYRSALLWTCRVVFFFNWKIIQSQQAAARMAKLWFYPRSQLIFFRALMMLEPNRAVGKIYIFTHIFLISDLLLIPRIEN